MKNDANGNETSDRLSEVEARLMAELQTLEARRTDIRNWLGTLRYIQHGIEEEAVSGNGNGRHLSAAARRAISKAQKSRWAKYHRNGKAPKAKGNANSQQPRWTSEDDDAIVRAIKLKNGPVDAMEMARLLSGKLKRTPGGVRQRMLRLDQKGVLKHKGAGMGTHSTVEVA